MIFNCIEQIGGFSNIEVYTLTEAQNWPVFLTDENSNMVTFTPEGESVDGQIITESIEVAEDPKLGPSGNSFNVKISFDFSSQSPALEQLLDQYKSLPVVVVTCKNFPQKKLFGAKNYPLRLDYETIHGRRPEDGTLTRIIIVGELPYRSVHILNEE